jgi:hypothetical protein
MSERCPSYVWWGDCCEDCELDAGHDGQHRATLRGDTDAAYETRNLVFTWEDNPAYVPPKPRTREQMTEQERLFHDSFEGVIKRMTANVLHNRFAASNAPVLGKTIQFRRIDRLIARPEDEDAGTR